MHITPLGEQVNGMLTDRATIRETEDLVASGKVDLAIAEDLARIYRNPRHREVGYPPSHHNCRTAVQQSHGLRLSILRV